MCSSWRNNCAKVFWQLVKRPIETKKLSGASQQTSHSPHAFQFKSSRLQHGLKCSFVHGSYPLFTETWVLNAIVLLTSLIWLVTCAWRNYLLLFVCAGRWNLSVLVVRNLSFSCQILTNLAVGDSAECLDEFGVWSDASNEEICECFCRRDLP